MQLFTPTQYLMIDTANAYGLDKEDWDDRLYWFKDNENQLETLTKAAENPAQYFAAVQAYRAARKGQAIGHMISLDATASGIQFLSLMSSCRTSAMQCNVVDVGHRQDAYTNNYRAMLTKVQNQVADLSRDEVKHALMTSLYASKQIPKDTFGDGSVLLDKFYETVQELLPGAWELNEALLLTWNPLALSHDWVMPDNFHVHAKVMAPEKHRIQFLGQTHEVTITTNKPMENGRANGANLTHSVDGMVDRELVNRCMMDPETKAKLWASLSHKGKSTKREQDKMVQTLWNHYENSGFLSSRILNYLDSMNMGLVDYQPVYDLLDSLPKRSFKVLGVHDCFRVHPNYGNDLRIQYNTILRDIAKSDLLSFLISQLIGTKVPVNKRDIFHDEVMEANYALS